MNNLILFLLPIVTIIFTSLFISLTSGQLISQSVTSINDYVQSNHARTYGGSLLTFSEIIRQKSYGNQVQQCPCVRPPGVDRCISYDSRFQGASIEEAILTFVDTSMDPRIYDNRIGGPIGSRSLLCSTEECRQCAAILAVRLRQIGLLQRSPTFSFPLPDFNQIQPQLCPRLRLSRTIPNLQPPVVAPSFVTQMVQAGLARIPARDTTPRTAFGAAVAAAIRQARSIRGRPFFDIIARIRNQRLQNSNGGGNRRNQQNPGNNNNGNGGGGGSRGISRPQQQQPPNSRPQGQFPTFPSPPFNQRPPQQPNTPNNFPNRVFPLPQQPRPPLQQPNPPQTFPVVPRPPQQPPFQQIPIQVPQQPQQPSQQPIFQPPPIIQQPGVGGGQQQPSFQTPPFIQQPIFQQPGGGGQQQQPIFQQPAQVPVFQQPPTFPQNPQFPNGQQGPDGVFSPQGPFASIQQPLGSAFSSLAQQGALQGFQHAVSAIPGLSGGNPLGGGGGAGQGGGSGGGIGFGGGAGGGGSPGGQFGNPGPGPGFPFGKRKKRAADDGILGDRFVISCVERGDTENEASDYLNLCTACWTWRQLPPDYFPRLINELVCNENDFCLSGWGSCQQRYRNVDVLRRGPNGAWQPTSISVATCCDCKVKAGTEVHALVIGRNKV